jgi:hypothetical protein
MKDQHCNFLFKASLKRIGLILMLATFAHLMIACSSASQQEAISLEPAPPMESGAVDRAAEAVPGEPMPSAAEDGASVPLEDYLAGAVQAQEARVIIYTGNISLVVRDTQEAVAAITALANEQGGYVSGSNIYRSNEVPQGSITIRIPAERYQTVLEQLRALALRVERESASSQDVTQEFTDLQARKANLESAEAALQELLAERRRTGNTSDILEVYRELTAIREQIEQIEGRLRYLANQAALSTLTIELIPDVLYQPITVAGWEPQGVAREALQALVVALQWVVNLLIWGVIFVLPLILIMLTPLVVLVLVIRRVRRSRLKKAA